MKNFCVNPFYGKHSMTLSDVDVPCCLVWADEEYSREAIQQDFLNNKKSPYCHICWRDEANGHTSRRQADNKWLSTFTGKDLETLYKNTHNPELLFLQYKVSNLCNLACKTCGSFDSTRWYAEDSHYGRYNYSDVSTNNHMKISDSQLKTLVKLDLLGGEPFIDKSHIDILKRLIDCKNTDLHLNYTTNGQQMPNPELAEVLNKFKNIQVNLSIDAQNKMFEYVRYPGSWDKLLNVLDKLKSTDWQITSYTTLSNINVYYYDELFEFLMKNFRLTDCLYQFVTDPVEFAVNVMPQNMKDEINNKFKAHKFYAFFKPIMNTINRRCDNALLDKFKETVGKQDAYRKCNPKEYVPELIEYLY